jgi:hypothetical protein
LVCLRQGQRPARDRARLDELLPSLRIVTGVAVRHYLENAVQQAEAWVEQASVAVLIGTFTSVVTLTSVMWFIQSGRLTFP